MRYLLDTCVLSELTKLDPDPAVVAWMRARDDRELAVSVVTVGELEKGVRRLPAGKRKRALRTWLDDLTKAYADRIVEVSVPVAAEWGRIAAQAEASGKPLPVVDAIIGSTAIVHGLTIVTRNTADMIGTGASIFDPWD